MRPARAKATGRRHPEIQHRHLSVSQLATRQITSNSHFGFVGSERC